MNIALIGQEMPPLSGGLDRQVQDCAAGLSRRGCGVRVLSIVGEGRGLAGDEILLRPGGSPIQVHRTSVPGADDPEPRLTAGACRGLAPHWCSLLADADAVCSFGASPALAGAEIRRRLGLPFIAVLPDLPAPSDTRFREVLGCGADLFVGLSRSLCRRAEERFGLPMTPVPMGVDTELYRPVAAPAAEAALHRYSVLGGIPGPLVTSPVRIDPRQGLEPLIEAFELVVALRPDATLLIAGHAGLRHHLVGNAYADYLSALVQMKELGARVRFGGGVFKARHMPALYSRSHLCVVAGGGEDFGAAPAESLACGTPVVAPRGEGMAEVLGNGTGGLLADGRDPVKVARAILSLLDDDALRRRLGRGGREHVRRAFPLRAQADRYLELFSSITAARAAA